MEARRRGGMSSCAFALALALTVVPRPSPGATGEAFVPWKVLNPGDSPLHGELVLEWIPASRDQLRRSPLLMSRPLAIFASRCVGMQIVRPDDIDRIEALGATGALPAAVLIDGNGAIVARVDGHAGSLSLEAVEEMVRDALGRRDADNGRLLEAADAAAASGEREKAVDLYRRVTALRCLFPRRAKEAERALHRLGERAR